jgi:outer membrane protein OmpA-like peptidoglycan-associated protein
VADEEEFSLQTGAGQVLFRLARPPSVLRPAEVQVAQRVAFMLRVGLEWRDSEVVAVAESLVSASFGERAPFRGRGAPRGEERVFEEIGRALTEELLAGRIVASLREVDPLRERDDGPAPRLEPLPPPSPEENTTFFEVRFVDEIGKAISGIAVELDTNDGEPHDLTTNAAGVALLDPSTASGATARVSEVESIEEVLSKRWTGPRPGSPPRESNMTELVFEGAPIGPVTVKPAVPNTVVLKPPLGRLHAQLFDKTGRVLHALRDYTISGPQELSGTTDEQGFLRHDQVFPGDYRLTLTLEFFEGDDQQTDEYESALVVIPAEQGGSQVRALGVVPYSVLAKLRFFFNTNKAFLLPTALPGIRKLRALYAENNPSKLLVVGHADTTAGPEVNDPLSLDRARATVAFLKDDVDAWLAFYDKPAGNSQRWGKPEDRMMLLSIPDFGSKPKREDAVTWFQRTRGLQVDGKCGPQTRRQLVTEYMALDGVSLADEGIEIEATAHGCGENFPLDESGGELDAARADEQRDPKDRRVELFFFDPEFGIAPAPPGENSKPGSTQYPAWRKSVIQTVVIEPSDAEALRATFAELADAHFRTNSAVVLPEGETPTKDESTGAALTAVGVFATVLRFNQEHPGRKLFVAGHTDTTADTDFNQRLSNERAQCALSLLTGERARFQALCDGRHTVSDYKQILAWASRALDDFDCDPGRIDDNEKTARLPVERFQTAYNRNKDALGVPPGTPDLDVDGDVGPLTWGAIFDCYEFALQQELGEDAAGLASLREALVFVDDDRKGLGFSEYFPIEELGVDNYRSQANRRVEIIFYESGEEPDLEHAEGDPETSEVYLPGVYVREPLQIMVSAKPWFASFDAPKVHAEEARLLNLVAPGLPAGTAMAFTISSDGVSMVTLEGVSVVDAASIPFDEWDAPEQVPFIGDLDPGQEFPVVTYDFEVEGGGRVVRSRAPLTYEDVIRLQLTLEQDGDGDGDPEILANQPYVVNTLWGRRRGQTDEQGMLVETGLPPGGATVVLRDRFLLDAEPLPFGWDKDES